MLSKPFGNRLISALKLFMFFDPVILLLGINPKKIIFDTEKALCTKLLIKALFIIIQRWKQTKFSL